MPNKVKVLLMDDEYLIRMSVAARLRKTNFEIVGVATPEEAITELKKECFQAILADVMIGSVDGFMFRDMVRGVSREIPIVFFTSIINDDGNQFLYRVMEDAYSSYVPKNAPNDVLIKHLEHVTRIFSAESSHKAMKKEEETTMHLASFVQTAMLPKWASVNENLYYGVCLQPYAQVSGDLYEWIPLGDDSALLILGDISGHGVSASLAMTAVQSYLKQFSNLIDSHARNVARIASQIDRFIYQNLSGIAYMSGLIIYMNAKENILRYCNAGHPELLCYSRATGDKIELNPENRGGLPLGMLATTTYNESDVVEISFNEDLIFFAISDGVFDISADEAGEDRLPNELLEELIRENIRSVKGSSSLAIVALPYCINSLLLDYGYTYHQDDSSLIVFGRCSMLRDEVCAEAEMDLDKIDLALKEISKKISAMSVPNIFLAERVELVLGEFLANLYNHGFEELTRHKECVQIRVRFVGNRVAVTVWHRAKPWQPKVGNDSPDAVFNKANATFSNHGRGVAMMQKICSSMTMQSYGDLNANTFYLPLNAENLHGNSRD